MARIVLADDHLFVRDGLRRLIETEPDLGVVGEAADGKATVATVAALRPDVLLLDVSMPGGSGIAVLNELRQASAATRILVLTMHEDPAYLRLALASGASGFLLKHAAGRELIAAIRALLEGRTYVDPTLAEAPSRDAGQDAEPDAERERLSPREREVLRDLALGFTDTEIAERLAVEVTSIDAYRARLPDKLGLERHVDLVRYALTHL